MELLLAIKGNYLEGDSKQYLVPAEELVDMLSSINTARE